jgi:hypothetical protein
MLRVLFLQAKPTDHRYYGSLGPDGPLSSLGPQNTVTITTGPHRKRDSHTRDNQSDKSILDEAASPSNERKIVQTNEVIVQYCHRRDTSSDEFELNRIASS